LLERGGDELGGVLLVTVTPRVGQGAEKPLGLRELGAGAAVLDLARSVRELPGPAGEDLPRRVRLLLPECAEEDADAAASVDALGMRAVVAPLWMTDIAASAAIVDAALGA
jgi:hypothetical protein